MIEDKETSIKELKRVRDTLLDLQNMKIKIVTQEGVSLPLIIKAEPIP